MVPREMLPRVLGLLIVVFAFGYIFSSGLLSQSIAGQVIAPNLTPPGQTLLPGYGVGAFSSCWDTDHGIKPGEPGATIVVIAGAPAPSGDPRPIMEHLQSAVIDYQLSRNGGTTYDIKFLNNGLTETGYLTIYPDEAEQSQPFSTDTPPSSSETGSSGSPDSATTTPSAVLTEYYCICDTSTSLPHYTYCNSLPKKFTGHTYSSDSIEYPKLFEQFMQNAANTLGQWFPVDASYLTS